MTIIVSPQAREDLNQAYQQIARDSPEAADRVLARIVEVIGMLASTPYRKSAEVFQVVRVYHQARRPIER